MVVAVRGVSPFLFSKGKKLGRNDDTLSFPSAADVVGGHARRRPLAAGALLTGATKACSLCALYECESAKALLLGPSRRHNKLNVAPFIFCFIFGGGASVVW